MCAQCGNILINGLFTSARLPASINAPVHAIAASRITTILFKRHAPRDTKGKHRDYAPIRQLNMLVGRFTYGSGDCADVDLPHRRLRTFKDAIMASHVQSTAADFPVGKDTSNTVALQ